VSQLQKYAIGLRIYASLN